MMIARLLLVVVSVEVAKSRAACSGSAFGILVCSGFGAGAVAVLDAIYEISARLIERVKVIESGDGNTCPFRPKVVHHSAMQTI
jgi:hypothetical protein